MLNFPRAQTTCSALWRTIPASKTAIRISETLRYGDYAHVSLSGGADTINLCSTVTVRPQPHTLKNLSFRQNSAKGCGKMKKNILVASFLLALIVSMLTTPIRAQPALDIVETAESDGRFTTLIFALEATGLNETLKSPGPFTVFAPTDDAFAALPPEVLNWLVSNPTALTEVLLYHVVSGKQMAADVVAMSSIETLQGGNLTITVSDTVVMIDGATIILTDIECSNGVIHVIDAVLMPEGVLDIVRTAIYAGSFTTLVTALQVADLVGALEGSGPFTVFAPTDDAFAALPPDKLAYLLDNPTKLADVLLYHVVSGSLKAEDVLEQGCLTTLQGGFLNIDVVDDAVMIDGATIILTDIECSNGVIHVIDAVLKPLRVHPAKAVGYAFVRFWWWRLFGLAKLEIYPFNTVDHPGGNPADRPACVWVVKLTVWVRSIRCCWHSHSHRVRQVKIEAYWIITRTWKYCSKRIVKAEGHAWTWNGYKLSRPPPDIVVATYHKEPYWTKAYGTSIFFCGIGI
jgi:transforming growth factor-beta-induced protein